MNKEDVMNFMAAATWKAAEVICDISRGGMVCYPNERIIVKLNGFGGDIELESGTFWTICDNLPDFGEGIVFGSDEARKAGCRYYVSSFKEVRELKI